MFFGKNFLILVDFVIALLDWNLATVGRAIVDRLTLFLLPVGASSVRCAFVCKCVEPQMKTC